MARRVPHDADGHDFIRTTKDLLHGPREVFLLIARDELCPQSPCFLSDAEIVIASLLLHREPPRARTKRRHNDARDEHGLQCQPKPE